MFCSIMTVANATEILQLLFKQRSFDMIVSMGAGAGYVEHTFRQAAQELEQPLQVRAALWRAVQGCGA